MCDPGLFRLPGPSGSTFGTPDRHPGWQPPFVALLLHYPALPCCTLLYCAGPGVVYPGGVHGWCTGPRLPYPALHYHALTTLPYPALPCPTLHYPAHSGVPASLPCTTLPRVVYPALGSLRKPRKTRNRHFRARRTSDHGSASTPPAGLPGLSSRPAPGLLVPVTSSGILDPADSRARRIPDHRNARHRLRLP